MIKQRLKNKIKSNYTRDQLIANCYTKVKNKRMKMIINKSHKANKRGGDNNNKNNDNSWQKEYWIKIIILC